MSNPTDQHKKLAGWQVINHPVSTKSRPAIGRENNALGIEFESLLARSLNCSFKEFGVEGYARRHNSRRRPSNLDVFVEGKKITIECKHRTQTSNRGDGLYDSRDFYATRNGYRDAPAQTRLIDGYARETNRRAVLAVEVERRDPEGRTHTVVHLVPWSILLDVLTWSPKITLDFLAQMPSIIKEDGWYRIDPALLIEVSEVGLDREEDA